jgi:hypothetical protein
MTLLLTVCLIILFIVVALSAVGTGYSLIWGRLHSGRLDTLMGIGAFVAAVISITFACIHCWR